MYQTFLILHILGAIVMGFYLLLPFLANRVPSLAGKEQVGYVRVLAAANRVGQIGLGVEFLTGGYMVSKAGYSVLWMVVAIVLFLALGAISGILGVNMKKVIIADNTAEAEKVKTLSFIAGFIFLIILVTMNFPTLL